VFRRKRRFYLVFEFMDHTLLEELEERSSTSAPGLGEATVRRHAFQILRGLDFCHASNVIFTFEFRPESLISFLLYADHSSRRKTRECASFKIRRCETL